MKYLASRGLIDAKKAEQRKVWAFLGDGETDEVESLRRNRYGRCERS